MRPIGIGTVGCVLLIGARLAWGEPVTLVRESAFRAEPSMSAATVANVAKGAVGETIGKSGIWVNVKTPEATGWVFTFNLRYGAERAGGSAAADAQAAGRLVTGRPRSTVVSTIGIRGLSEEDLQNAAFNRAENDRLEALSASREDAEQHARAAGLEPARVNYLEEK